MKGGNKGGHRLTTSSTTTVTTVSPLAITTVSPQSDSSLTSTADLSTAATTVSSASSTSMSLAAVFETEMQPPSKTNSGNDVLITNGNLGRGNHFDKIYIFSLFLECSRGLMRERETERQRQRGKVFVSLRHAISVCLVCECLARDDLA